MKKLLALALALTFTFSLAACSSAEEATGDTSAASDSNIVVDDGPRYTSDGELIEEQELPASDSDISE